MTNILEHVQAGSVLYEIAAALELDDILGFCFWRRECAAFCADSAKEAERIREMAAADERSMSEPPAVRQITGEEISGYKAGILSAEKTTENIESGSNTIEC